ncbi:hypothetical protein N9933_00470 [bacterium]|nr:hypothetical protein [bacterium]
MKDNKLNFNIPFLILGVISLYLFYHNAGSSKARELPSLTSLTVELATNIQGIKSKDDYLLYTKEYPAQFEIINGSIPRNKYSATSNLQKGDVITLKINDIQQSNVTHKDAQIIVYEIVYNGKSLLSTDEFQSNRLKHSKRIGALCLFLAIFFMSNGSLTISRKTNLLIIVVMAGIALALNKVEIL